MSNLDMNEVNSHLDEINEMYTEETYWHRLKKIFTGLKAPRVSKEYKEAIIELQRLSAPITAILLPLFAVGLLMVMTAGTDGDDRVIETEIMVAEEIKDLEQIKDIEEPPEQTDMNIDVPVDSPDVQVNDTPDTPMSPQPQAFDAVMRALRWLKKNQKADGSWPSSHKPPAFTAMTSLAVLTFLAHNEKPGESVEFGPTVQKALEYLIGVQNKTTGRLPGNYDHPMAAYALCEAYGMTINPNVKIAAEKAMVPIIKGQHPTGGWTYNMNPNVEDGKGHGEAGKYRDDTSYMGWCAQALKAAKMAKLQVEGLDKASKLAVKGFKKNARPNGGFGYTSPTDGAPGLASVGALCMQLLGAGNDSDVKKAMDIMEPWLPSFEPKGPQGSSLQYYFYYATQAKFNVGGKRWENWNKEMKPIYVKAQKIEKNAIKDETGRDCDIGWWENADNHTDRPVMDTCLAALQLMVYYRFLPTMSDAAVKVEEELIATSTDTEDIKVDTGNL